MKIKSLAVAATAFMHAKAPDGTFLYDGATKQPIGIDFYSPGSAEAAQVEERASARVVQRMADNDNKVSLEPLAQRRQETAADLATLTAGFRHIEYDGPDGQPLGGQALFAAVYADPELGWLKEQGLKFQRDWGKFPRASAKS